MINTPTVLILGAGASCPYGFPTGLQLKARICKALIDPAVYQERESRKGIQREMRFDDDLRLYWAIKNLPEGTDPGHISYLKHNPHDVKSEIREFIYNFTNDLMFSPDASIDAFLEHHPDYREIGHYAIASTLLPYENPKTLFEDWIDKWDNPENKEKHWYQYFFPKLNCPLDNFGDNKLSIITFNYDRSFEFYLLRAIRAKYKGIDWEQAKQTLRKIPIVHLYGKLGSLLGDEDDPDKIIPYGGIGNKPDDDKVSVLLRNNINLASECINTVYEEYAPNQPTFVKARNLIKNAERVYFLGFGYLEENMKRLFTENVEKPYDLIAPIFWCGGTILGLSIHACYRLSSIGLVRGEHSKINTFFPNATIYDFLHNCEHSVLT